MMDLPEKRQKHTKSYGKLPFIVDLRFKNGDFPYGINGLPIKNGDFP